MSNPSPFPNVPHFKRQALSARTSPMSLIGNGVELDSVRDTSFRQIWNNGRGFSRIRAFSVPEECCGCDSYITCSGGCRARAWEAHRDLGAPDPWCKNLQPSF